MKKILIAGALGQIGGELTMKLRELYGDANVVATNRREKEGFKEVMASGPFEIVDIKDPWQIADAVKQYKIDTIINLAAILSAAGEKNPDEAWHVNMGGLYNVLEVAREKHCAVFTPSSIAVFGPSTPKDQTPQNTIQRPNTIYGVTKVSGELLSDYYYMKYSVDTRGVRLPGLISYQALPGGGTTDYAVHIFYEALKHRSYTCYIREGTYMDMMYMPDALDAIINLAEADPARFKHRNAFNVSAMSFTPEDLCAEIQKYIPDFEMDYAVDPDKQAIADSWPNSMDDSTAREEWGWWPKYDLPSMTLDMLDKLSEKLDIDYRK